MQNTLGKKIVHGAIAAFALMVASHAAQAADEVKLLKVKSTHTVYKNSYHSGRFEALVANLAYAKQVDIWLKKTDGSWTAVPLSYDRQGPAGKEVWKLDFANTLPPTPDTIEFAVRYIANGQTYWDNNNGQNYTITHEGGTILVGTNVYNGQYQPTYNLYGGSTTLGGYVTVKNLAPVKTVQVHYSTDNWTTTQIVNATFNPDFWHWGYSSVNNPNAYGFEEWSFSLPVGTTANQVKYAIKYTVNGQTYWDNNFGQNYTSNLVRY